MGGYIGAKTGTLVASASDIRGDISATDTTPEITLKNTTETDADGTRSGKITFKGEQSGGEESVLAQIQGSHDGTADDEKGDLIFKTNDGNDALAPTERLRINSAGDVLVSSPDPSLTITNTTEEDSDGGRESTIVFKGEQSGGELSTLAEIEASHDGTADDEKGDLIFKTNDGSDGVAPTERLRIDSDGSILTATLGTDNVHIGEGAAASIASGGNQNVAIGKDAGTALTTGDSNTFIGAKVGDAITTASANVAIGGDATYAALGSDTQGKFTTAIGVGALRAQNFTSDTASNNTAVGYFAGGVMTTGTANTFIGGNAGDDCVDGIQNVAVGYAALSADAGNNNTAVGESALTSTTGASNSAFGNGCGNAITSGSNNVIIGHYTGNQHGIDIRTASNNVFISNGNAHIAMIFWGGDSRVYFLSDVKPWSDNAYDLGGTSNRWDDVYATNGTIQTSDENEKQNIASLTSAEITAASAISKLFKTFKWKDSVAAKGDKARTHSGVVAQQVETAMSDAGLDAGDYAFFTSTTWWETKTEVEAVAEIKAEAAVYGDDGELVKDAVMAQEAQDAYTRTDTYNTADEAPEGATERNRKGIRYPELLAFVGAATEQRLTSIESRLTALEAE